MKTSKYTKDCWSRQDCSDDSLPYADVFTEAASATFSRVSNMFDMSGKGCMMYIEA